MKLLRVGLPGAELPAAIYEGNAYDVSQYVIEYDQQFWSDNGLERLQWSLAHQTQTFPTLDISTLRIGPPIPKPSKIVCVGLNYMDHIQESAAEVPTEPVIFMKAPNTVVGPYDEILIPPHSVRTDYEVELAVVIGKTCRYLPSEDAALRAIGGYAISNDLSERENQLERGGQWVKGKSAETFNPLGPYLVTPADIPKPQRLDLELRVNGEVRQSSNTSEMIYDVARIIHYLSQFMVLEPGDLINTGTPPGVAHGMAVPRYLAPGDEVEVSIQGLGFQRQTCKQAR